MKKIKISPSILAADFSQLGNEIKRLEEERYNLIRVTTELTTLRKQQSTPPPPPPPPQQQPLQRHESGSYNGIQSPFVMVNSPPQSMAQPVRRTPSPTQPALQPQQYQLQSTTPTQYRRMIPSQNFNSQHFFLL